MHRLQPPGWPRPRGYSQGVSASGRLVVLAGQVGWNRQEQFEAADFPGQARQALRNIVELLAEAGAGPADLVRLTWFIADRRQYLDCRAELGEVYRETVGAHYPAMSVIEVSGFIEDGALLEIEATAVVADPD